MLKALKLIFCNILVFILIFFLFEITIYIYYSNNFYKTHPKIYKIKNFSYNVEFPLYFTNLRYYFNGKDTAFYGRLPDGENYKNEPIVIFGCSYALGQYLGKNQTISAKLSETLKRPVYNRAISGGSFQHMYMQSISDSFYASVPVADNVIYIMIGDHYRRALIKYFDVLEHCVMVNFSQKNGKLIQYNYDNRFLNFLNALYISKHFNHLYVKNYINNPQNADKLTDLTVLYFTETRKEIEKHWGRKVNFSVIMYEDWEILYKNLLKQKLEQEGFNVILTTDLTDEDLRTEKWQMQDNHHPKESAWDMLTPKIIECLNLD